jgi:hypothetical protein
MGQELPYAREREIKLEVSGWDQVDRVELLKNNRVIHRDFPMDRAVSTRSWDQPVLVRFEYGWGPWPALGMARICDWDIRVKIEGGVLEEVQTCFQSGPFDETRRDRVLERTERSLRVRSFTALRDMIEDVPTKAVVLKLRGTPETRVTVALEAPARVSLTQSLRELAESSETLSTGPFPRESALLHRLVFREHSHTSYTVPDRDEGAAVNWYYVRVTQANGQLAWSSPIWVNRLL